MSALAGFNNVLMRFFEKVMKWYPDLSDLRLIYRGIETLKKYNPRMVLDQFLHYIGPYYVEIFNKQEEFFTDLNNIMKDPNVQNAITNNNDSSNNSSNNSSSNNSSSVFERMVVFKQVYEQMDNERKTYVWKMFGALLKVGALASNNPDYKVILDYVQAHPELFDTTNTNTT